MIHIVTSDNLYLFKDEMEQAYRLRHRIFVEEMKWSDLAKPDGREIDQFDDEHAVHMLYVESGKVLGYQRMLPTSGRTCSRRSCPISARTRGRSGTTSGNGPGIASSRRTGSEGGP
jgi:predicted GNAT family N-acyltransferase